MTKDLYVAEIIFGHTVQGQIESNKKEIACLRVSVENIYTQLKAFWDLESIVIAESNEKNITYLEIINEFKENIKFTNGRHETRLLCKNSRDLHRNNLQVARKLFSSIEH